MGEYTTVSARLDTQLKENAEQVLNTLGLTHSTAIAALYSQIVLQNGMPFELTIPQRETPTVNTSDARTNNIDANNIDDIQAVVSEKAQEYGINRVWLFGSRTRGTAQKKSDIDLLIDKGDLHGLECGGFVYDLERSLKTPVDVVMTSSVPEKLKTSIERDKVLLYER